MTTAADSTSSPAENPADATPITPAGEEDMAVYMTVYPPPESGAAPLVLEPLPGGELAIQVKALLGELAQTCIYSAYRLVAVTPKAPDVSTKNGGGAGGAPATAGGDGGSVWEGGGDVMNDFVELKTIPAVAARPEKVEVGVGYWVVFQNNEV